MKLTENKIRNLVRQALMESVDINPQDMLDTIIHQKEEVLNNALQQCQEIRQILSQLFTEINGLGDFKVEQRYDNIIFTPRQPIYRDNNISYLENEVNQFLYKRGLDEIVTLYISSDYVNSDSEDEIIKYIEIEIDTDKIEGFV